MEDSADIVARFETFFSDYIDENGSRKYDDMIGQMELSASISLTIDYDDLLRFDSELARKLLESPEFYIEMASLAIKHRLRIISEEYAYQVDKFHARFRNLEPTNRINLRKIRANHIGKLIQISGILTRVNKVVPLMIRGVFKCLSCNEAIIPVDQEDNEFTKPLICPQCNKKGPFKLLLERSTYIDWQKIRVQEKPEELPPGQMPRFMDGYLLEDIVDLARPGDRVNIVGILKAKQESSQQGKLTIFKTFIDINHIEKQEVEIENLQITAEQEEEIKQLANDPWVYRKLIKSVAPSIYGLEEIKEAVLLQLFSGVSRLRKDGTTRRGQIHVLLVGDPGVGKSVHYNEEIYLYNNSLDDWKIKYKIGNFVDTLLSKYKNRIIKYKDTEILDLKGLEDFYTQSFNFDYFRPEISKILEVSRHKSLEIYEIKLQSGIIIKATGNHSFTTLKNGKLILRNMSDLELGDYLPISRKIDYFKEVKLIEISDLLNKRTNQLENLINYKKNRTLRGNQKNIDLDKLYLTESLGRIFGLFLANGRIEKDGISISYFDEDIKIQLEKDFKLNFKSYTTSKNIIKYRSVVIREVFKKLFYFNGVKSVPELFFYAPRPFLQGFISGYFSGKSKINKRNVLGIRSKSKRLLLNLRDLLNLLGIQSIIKVSTKSHKRNNVIDYKLLILKSDLVKFFKLCYFINNKEQKNLYLRVKREHHVYSYNKLNLLDTEINRTGISLGTIPQRFVRPKLLDFNNQKVLSECLGTILALKRCTHNLNKKYQDAKILGTSINKNVFWDKIISITKLKNEFEYVYDIGTENNHFILANGHVIVHNSQILKSAALIAPRGIYTSGKGTSAAGLTASVLRDKDTGNLSLEAGVLVLADQGLAAIDEFDKMRPEDRISIHESMEQLCFHPNTEILLIDGRKIKIGEFIDDAIESRPKEVVKGINCEILPFQDIGLYTTDFEQIYKSRINRLSRHIAPSNFYKIEFSNGRSIIVTPEHPVFKLNGLNIDCVKAENCSIGDYIPAPRYLPNSTKPIALDHNFITKLQVKKEPNLLTLEVAELVGHFFTSGNLNSDISTQIQFSNLSKNIINEVTRLLNDLFGIIPIQKLNLIDYTVVYYDSYDLYYWFKINFPELMDNNNKRVPSKILGASKEIAKSFLTATFRTIGEIFEQKIYFVCQKKVICEDLQDLLLKLGISSYIKFENRRHKLFISPCSLQEFVQEIFLQFDQKEPQTPALKDIFYDQFKYDTIPVPIENFITKITEKICPNSSNLSKFTGINKPKMTKELALKLLNEAVNKLYKIQQKLKKLLNTPYSSSSYLNLKPEISLIVNNLIPNSELIEYINQNKDNYLNKDNIDILIKKIKKTIGSVKSIQKLIKSDIKFLRIVDIQKIKNEKEYFTPWVYDITIEPNHNFVSHGVILHNTVSIAKAGIIATLNSRTSILAAANPFQGRYDPYKTVAENIKKLPPTILSRFDLIFLIRDQPSPTNDERMANFILSSEETPQEPPIDHELLKNYIYYAKKNCKPRITKEAIEVIKQFYLQTRIAGADPETPIPITARYLEALIRLAEARAKVLLHEEVTAEDAQSVIQLMTYSLGQVGIDQETGVSDIDAIETGITTTHRRRLDQINQLIRELTERKGGQAVSIEEIKEAASRLRISEEQVESELNTLRMHGVLYQPKEGYYKIIED
ncbi:MAG: LAGLIDADG family homing endonuclease [Candidatus Helarchaeota archaeon]